MLKKCLRRVDREKWSGNWVFVFMQGILPTSAALLTIAKICQLKFVGPSITTHKQPRAITTICAFFNRPGAWNFGCEKTTQPSKQNLFCSSDYIFHLSATFDEHSNSKIYSINWLEFLLTRLFQAQQQQGTASSSAAGNIPAQLFEAIFAQALSQSSQSQAGLHLGHLDQSHLNASSDQSSPPVSTALAEDTSTVVSTPTSAAAPAGVQQADEEAAKFMAQLLRDAPASLLSQLPGQSQPTSPNLQGNTIFRIHQKRLFRCLAAVGATPIHGSFESEHQSRRSRIRSNWTKKYCCQWSTWLGINVRLSTVESSQLS